MFDRAEARDFSDVHELAARFGTDELLDQAAQVDAGFDVHVFAEMLGHIERHTDEELARSTADPAALRAFVRQWRADLLR